MQHMGEIPYEDTDTQERESSEGGSRGWGDTPTSQTIPGPQELEQARKGPPLKPSERTCPLQHLSLDFLLPELRE